jgi:alcohol/geraniol dehydrogenase (NADP+)
MKDVAGTMDLILSTVNANEEWNAYLQTLRPTGTLCLVGIPPSAIALQVSPLIAGMRSVTGNPTGSPARLREMLDIAARHGVKAKTERFAMADANEAIKKVLKNKVRYRAVLAN